MKWYTYRHVLQVCTCMLKLNFEFHSYLGGYKLQPSGLSISLLLDEAKNLWIRVFELQVPAHSDVRGAPVAAAGAGTVLN